MLVNSLFFKVKFIFRISDRTVNYLEEVVFIRSKFENRFLLVPYFNSNNDETIISMSPDDKSLFIIKKGLDSVDGSAIYLSFLYYSTPNFYVRHHNGRIILIKYDRSILVRQDITFKLIPAQKDFVVLQAINLPDYFFLSVDPENSNQLVLIERQKDFSIDQIDDRYLFQIIRFI
jgi:hypothetical protein